MNLRLLHAGPHLTIYYDSHNDWLFADWQGELTLPTVQTACLELARCYLGHTYPRVLNSNASVTSVSWDVAVWLAHEFLPTMELSGVQQLAWVCAPVLRSRHMAQEMVNRLPHLGLMLFNDLEEAVAWLQRNRIEYSSDCTRLPTTQAYLDEAFQQLVQYVAAQQLTSLPT